MDTSSERRDFNLQSPCFCVSDDRFQTSRDVVLNPIRTAECAHESRNVPDNHHTEIEVGSECRGPWLFCASAEGTL